MSEGEGEGEEDESGLIDGVGGGGGRHGREPRKSKGEKEAQAGHPHIAHSYLIWLSFPYSTTHDSLLFSPQKQPEVGAPTAASVNSDGWGSRADIEQRRWWMNSSAVTMH